MNFNSIQFIFFFPVVATLYFALSYRFRWMLLLGASYYFYMCWKAEYLLLIIISTLITYATGIWIGNTTSRARRKFFLLLSLISNLGILFVFKYFNFFNDSIQNLFGHWNMSYHVPPLNILLPVGISFYTFQILSYSIDVYRGQKKPERHLGIFALYVVFFPQLVAGPIERSTRLLPQFFKKHDFDYQRITDGLKLMLWGFFKKIVIADRIGIIVDQVYNSPENYTGMPLIIASYLFAIQIYCDFSGYSDIAIGSARVMGFNLMDNFKRPYFSKSIAEFWRRWHISLSTWFKDYLYIPMGGNRVKKCRWHINIAIVFLITGFWHGANWTFMIWGLLHGFYILFSNWSEQYRKMFSRWIGIDKYSTVLKTIKVIITFHLVVFAWIFFRANTIQDALYIIRHLLTDIRWENGFGLGMEITEWIIIGSSIFLLEFVHILQSHLNIREYLSDKPIILRWAAYYFILFSIILFGEFGSNSFIYFQF